MSELIKEELLRPRFKVIADFPDSCLDVGEIITIGEGVFETVEWWRKYPHIFKELKWFEERTKDEMPKYVESNYDGGFKRGMVSKVVSIEQESSSVIFPTCLLLCYIEGYNNRLNFANLLPATEQEYLQFKKP